ncbi:MAG TPA: alpha/beta hydrolase, partial [Arenibacter sp.]|nr:alpha/beta hydrolase [Arenibacter sp.]
MIGKKVVLTLIIGFISLSGLGQDISGAWNGVLKVQGIQLRLVFNIDKTANGYIATMDSPDQGTNGIPVTTTSFDNSLLKISIASAGIEYEGVLDQDHIINGNFRQAGQSFPLSLSKSEKVEKSVRPQEPIKPYPYYEEEIYFENREDAVKLSGTLTLPRKDGFFPAVILISGSGPQNRDEELMGHKPFLVLSDYLTKNGIAVLRYDDRGVGASTGDFKTATSLDFSKDAEAGVQYLKTRKEIDTKKIGLIGHSEGGLIAP